MIQRKKKTIRKKVSKKKGLPFGGFVRLCSLLFLFLVLVFSVCTVGYVIFFRTVLANEIPLSNKSAIVFEEPDPPESVELVTEANNIQEPDLPQIALLLPKVAIIIDDMGYHESIEKELLALPIELTYSFLPFAPHTKTLERLAYRSGKTVLLHLPLQPKGNAWDPGPGALTLEDLPEVQTLKLEKCLDEVPHAVGVNNHMGSLYTENQVAMTRLIHEIGDRTLFFIDSYTSPRSVGLPVAQGLNVKSARRHVFLDNVLDQTKICTQLDKLINVAESSGVGIGIGHPHQETLAAISSCGESYRTRVQFVSIKDVLL